MTRKSKGSAGADSAFDRVFAILDEGLAGMHDVTPSTGGLHDLPPALLELYAYCDGARLFLDSIEIHPPSEVAHEGDRWTFATMEEEPVAVDVKGRVWRDDASVDAMICDGSSLDRWLAGIVDSTAMLYDADGEFADDVFDEDGDVLPIVVEKQLRAQLKRDPKAAGPRWRLVHALLAQEALPEARRQLEELVANDATFPWAWLQLAKMAEASGDLAVALDDASAAADAAKGHEQEGYFWSQVARIAARAGDEPARAIAAAQASRLAPDLKAAQLAGARAQLIDGDHAAARGLVDLLRAVWPRDLEVLDLAKQLDAREN